MQYKCPECDKYFRNKDLLNRHVKRLHQNQVKTTNDKTSTFQVKGQVNRADDESNNASDECELESADEKTTYQCGACSALVDGEVSVCPYCGAQLTWS